MADKVLILILNYRTYELTLALIEILIAKIDQRLFDVLVVDNASPNGSADILQKESNVRGFAFISSQENGGYAKGNNIGLRYAYDHGYEYVWVLNNDILIAEGHEDVLEIMVAAMNRDKSLGSVNSKIRFPSGGIDYEFPKRPSMFDYTLGMVAYKKSRKRYDHNQPCGLVYRPQGCSMLLRTRAMADVGFLDENTFLYCEEDILAERFLAKGYRCGYCGNTEVIHNHSTTVSKTFDKFKTASIKNTSFKHYLRAYRGYNPLSVALVSAFRYLTYLR